MIQYNCPVCNIPIIGRSDKKYCSDQCRFIFNNQHKTIEEAHILNTNKQLRKNRNILKSLCPEGKATVRKDVMIAMQYNFSLFSTLFITSKKQLYYLCYDYGFTPILENGTEKALIVTRQHYMREWQPWRFVK